MQKIHHITLTAVYQSGKSYENLLNLDNSVSLQRYLELSVTEIFKSASATNPKFMWSYFTRGKPYNKRGEN